MEDENLRKFVHFKGTITRDGVSLPISLRIRLGRDGELRFQVYPFAMTSESFQFSDLQKGERFLTIEARSMKGTVFRCDNLILSSSGTKTREDRAWVTMGFHYSKATFTQEVDEPRERPVIRRLLRGFEVWFALRASCPLGDIVMNSQAKPKEGELSGVMTIAANEAPADLREWEAQVDKLTDHVLDLMSLALAHHVRDPVKELFADATWQCTTFNQTYVPRNAQHVMYGPQLQPLLDAAVTSFFAPPIEAQNLGFALEWFAMPATYTEMRLMNVMTALENLIDSNLSEDDKHFLPPNDFEKEKRHARRAIGDALRGRVTSGDEERSKAVETLIAALPPKMLDLNRKPLVDKLHLLASRWGVPFEGLPVDEIGKAIGARNNIVHRGYYYEPEAGSREQQDLWDHVLLMREVAIRFILTIVGFEGTYLSFRGGQHDIMFPPLSASASASA